MTEPADPQRILDRLQARGLYGRGTACRREYEPDPTIAAQDAIETGSQVVGADDEWA
jgi:hypothetical protein